MASRSNTPLHVAVILLIFLVVILGITTFVFYNKADSAYNEMEAAATREQNATKRANNLNYAYQLLLVTLGESTAAPVDIDTMRTELKAGDAETYAVVEKIENRFNEDMKLFPAGYADTKAYPQLPQELYKVIKGLNAKLADAEQREKDNLAKIETIRATEDARATKAEGERDAARQEVTRLTSQYSGQFTSIQKANADLTQVAQTRYADFQTKLENANKEIQNLNAQLDKALKLAGTQQARLDEMTKTSFDHPDGKVVSIRQGTPRIVVINLGMADGLRRQQTFSIYDQNEGNLANAKPKGSIEVMRVSDPHLAEARILDDQISNPILPGDVVFSPTWEPGQRLHFALAGLLDYDGDGRSDASIIKSAITYNGGVIDAEVDEAGNRTGTVSIETRYLVKGDQPTEKSSADALKNYSELTTEAKAIGIEEISVDKLLSMMGFRPDVRTRNLGAHGGDTDSGPSKFPRRPTDAYK